MKVGSDLNPKKLSEQELLVIYPIDENAQVTLTNR